MLESVVFFHLGFYFVRGGAEAGFDHGAVVFECVVAAFIGLFEGVELIGADGEVGVHGDAQYAFALDEQDAYGFFGEELVSVG